MVPDDNCKVRYGRAETRKGQPHDSGDENGKAHVKHGGSSVGSHIEDGRRLTMKE